MKFKCGSLFAGIGGFCLGFERAGFQTVWANDLDPDAALVYGKNFPKTKLLNSDLKDVDLANLARVDVIHGGFPCQSFSQAGNRMGFDDPKGRGQLFHIMMDRIESLGESKPSFLVFENAPYLKIGNRGAWFTEVSNRIKMAGYWFSEASCFEICPSKDLGAVQARNRLFMVAALRSKFSCNPVFEIETTAGHEPSLDSIVDRSEKKDDAYYLDPQSKYFHLIDREKNSEKDERIFQLRKFVVRPQRLGHCPTLTANMGEGGHNVPFIHDAHGIRKLTEMECFRLQGFPENFCITGVGRTAAYRLAGNAIYPGVSEAIARNIKKALIEEIS